MFPSSFITVCDCDLLIVYVHKLGESGWSATWTEVGLCLRGPNTAVTHVYASHISLTNMIRSHMLLPRFYCLSLPFYKNLAS